jgi:hypothetical protein
VYGSETGTFGVLRVSESSTYDGVADLNVMC